MNLIIRDALVNPPTWFTSFRDLTLYCHTLLKLDAIIEVEWSYVDLYYHWLKERGGMDYIEDFVKPGIEDGIHLDIEHNYARTVVTDRIIPENTHQLIDRIRVA